MAFMVIVYSKPSARIQDAQFAVTDGFVPRGDHAVARGGNGCDALVLEVDGYGLDLSLTATKPPIPHYGDGIAGPGSIENQHPGAAAARYSAGDVAGEREAGARDLRGLHRW
jgi:hypothetical protein